MKLENWGLVPRGPGMSLIGDVYGDSRREDGKCIITSNMMAFDFDTESVITESGSFYQLGKVAADYEAEFPNARQRLIDQFK